MTGRQSRITYMNELKEILGTSDSGSYIFDAAPKLDWTLRPILVRVSFIELPVPYIIR